MKLFKNGVGRPSNETKKKRRLFVFGTITLSVAAGLLVALLISTISINNLSGKALGNYSGDVDGDGLVTQKDAQKILRFSARLEKYTAAELKIADMNKDGKITQKDAVMAQKVAAKNYTIIFNNSRADNGSGKMDDVELGRNAINLPKCSFENEGYSFKGWIVQRKQDGKYYGKIKNKNGWYTSNELFKGKNNGTYVLYKDGGGISLYKLGVKEGTKVTLYADWKKSSSSNKAKSNSNSNNKNVTTKKTSGVNRAVSQRRCENSGNHWYGGKCYRNSVKLENTEEFLKSCLDKNGKLEGTSVCYYNETDLKTLCKERKHYYVASGSRCCGKLSKGTCAGKRYYLKDMCKYYVNGTCYKGRIEKNGMSASDCASRNGINRNGYCYYGTPKY